ncbi:MULTISPECIES: Fur family transcriptional regulator [Snodgrassella]|uniref:Fur family transcriptional regulator n=1 Tax=Snodgrassella TaxID=1193515 RepID=UPI00226A896E|nr:Fur family transcriptional regulator [Snodgrassella sp. B3800]MCX8746346.1 transcriptional repressor [Snodgrassella sp. B3800]
MSSKTVWQSKAEEKARIIAQCVQHSVTITQLREQVLDIVLNMSGVIKAYQVLTHMQQHSSSTIAPPTAYRALDFWAEQGVLHKIPAVNGYILCRHVQHECDSDCHEDDIHHNDFVLVCNQCGTVDEQSLSSEWAALRRRAADNGFILNDEHIVLTGICLHCQLKPA